LDAAGSDLNGKCSGGQISSRGHCAGLGKQQLQATTTTTVFTRTIDTPCSFIYLLSVWSILPITSDRLVISEVFRNVSGCH